MLCLSFSSSFIKYVIIFGSLNSVSEYCSMYLFTTNPICLATTLEAKGWAQLSTGHTGR